ncbi:MAG: hypothetical protein SYC29_13065 [Planctomycetota bacterium]|nr:hypothetical protein [Planctomycetota bacterium]
MTSAQTMQPGNGRRVPRPALAALILTSLAFALPAGCGPQLERPAMLEAPYDSPRLWAVAPMANESGASIVDGAAMADAFMKEAQQVGYIDVIPVNRVIRAMRELRMTAVDSHGDALTLMNVLDLDGFVVGTVTAYDPYRPMTLGMAVQLYARSPHAGVALDPQALGRSIAGDPAPGELGPPHPVAQAAGVFDAANHDTVRRLRDYASGRSEPDSAYEDEIYLVSMDLYTQFVCHRLIADLLASERARLMPMAKEPR